MSDKSELLLKPPVMASNATLRDYFAAHALQGLLAADTELNGRPLTGRPPLEGVVRRAYRFADAMLKEREK